MGCILAIMSGKGGVGKTTLTASLGGDLHRAGKRVLITDADFGMRDLDLVVGKEDEIFFDAVDIWKDNCTSDYAILSLGDGFDFLPATQSRRWEDVGRKGYAKLISKLAEQYDYVIIDSPAGIGRGNEAIFKAAEQIILVAEPLWVSMRAVQRVVQMCREIRQLNYTLVLNGVGHSGAEVSVEDALAALQIEQLGTILPYREDIQNWSQEGILHEEVDPFFDEMMDTLVQALITDHYEPEETILDQWKSARVKYAAVKDTEADADSAEVATSDETVENTEVVEGAESTVNEESVETVETTETVENVETTEQTATAETAETTDSDETAETIEAAEAEGAKETSAESETAEDVEESADTNSEEAEVSTEAKEEAVAEGETATKDEAAADDETVAAEGETSTENETASTSEEASNETAEGSEATAEASDTTAEDVRKESQGSDSDTAEEPAPKKKRGGLASLLRRQLASLWSRRSRMR